MSLMQRRGHGLLRPLTSHSRVCEIGRLCMRRRPSCSPPPAGGGGAPTHLSGRSQRCRCLSQPHHTAPAVFEGGAVVRAWVVQESMHVPRRLLQVQTALVKAPAWVRMAAMGAVVFVLSYATAYGETLTIAHVSEGLLASPGWHLQCMAHHSSGMRRAALATQALLSARACPATPSLALPCLITTSPSTK